MNRTQRAIIRAQKEAQEMAKRQKNDDISQMRTLIKKKKSSQGVDKIIYDNRLHHMSDCIKKDKLNESSFVYDVILYKNRFAAEKKRKEALVV